MNLDLACEELKQGVVYITQGSNVLYKKAKGFTDASQETLLTLDSLFPVASITKMFTAAALLHGLHVFYPNIPAEDLMKLPLKNFLDFSQVGGCFSFLSP